jgi:hypothetical protein
VKPEAVNAIAQLIAAIGVIVSLFYLAAQIRQNTRSTRAVVVDSLTRALVELLGQQTQRPELIRSFSAMTESWHGATGIAREPCPSFSQLSSFSRMRRSSSAKTPWIGSDGKVGMLIFASIITGPE